MRKLIARLKHWLDIENEYSDYDKDAYSYKPIRPTMLSIIVAVMAFTVIIAAIFTSPLRSLLP